MRKILVTGAGGFIGSHVVEAALDAGFNVRAMVHYNSSGTHGWLTELPRTKLDGVEVVSGDVRDKDFVDWSMRGVEGVLHLAALIGIPYSYVSPASYVQTNVVGSLNVFQAARDLGIDRVVHTSTSEVYGTALYAPIDENHPLQGQSPYSATKIAADQLGLSFWRSFSTPIVVLRPFNTYGPRQSLRAVIPTIITQILLGKSEIQLGSLTPTRDLTYVEDTADAFLRALKSPNLGGETIQLGTGFEISIGDLVLLIAEVMNAEISVATDDLRTRPEKSEVERLLSTPEKAKNLLDWKAELSGRDGLKLGIQRTADWLQSRMSQDQSQWEGYHV